MTPVLALIGHQARLDCDFGKRDSTKVVNAEGRHHGGPECSWRESPNEALSEPNKSASDIYERLKYKKMPFRKIKIQKSL